jgi:phosphonate transport system substrate-binding protein
MKYVMQCLLILSAVFFVFTRAENLKAEDLREIVFALRPDKNPDAMMEQRKTLEAFLSKELKVPVKVIVPLSSAVILEGLSNATVDLAFLGSLDMLNAIDQRVAQAILGVEFDGRNFYESYWVSLKGKPYTSISNLRGKQVAFASRTSTSGYLIPHAALIKKGLLGAQQNPEIFFGKGNVWYGSGYVSAVERVLQGHAEAAAVSDYVINQDKYLTPEQKSRLQIVERQGPVPTHTIAMRRSLSETTKRKLQKALEKLNTLENVSLRDQLFNSKLAEIDEQKHLAGTKEALELTGAKL